MPKKKKPKMKQRADHSCFSNTAILTHPPIAEKSAPFRIVSDKENETGIRI
jgi:hypothetical protein